MLKAEAFALTTARSSLSTISFKLEAFHGDILTGSFVFAQILQCRLVDLFSIQRRKIRIFYLRVCIFTRHIRYFSEPLFVLSS